VRLAILALPVALTVSACDRFSPSGNEIQPPVGGATAPTKPRAAAGPATPAADPSAAPSNDYGATPMNERVAVLGLLNKRNNVSEEIKLKPGEAREIGPVIIRVSACERTAPWELPQQTGAFVQVDIRARGRQQHARVFSGWMFLESPSLNVVEHPVYDVWVKDCTMSFPGEEGPASPKAEASDKPAARPSSSPRPSPAASPSPPTA
jgi:hypothetical protein